MTVTGTLIALFRQYHRNIACVPISLRGCQVTHRQAHAHKQSRTRNGSVAFKMYIRVSMSSA